MSILKTHPFAIAFLMVWGASACGFRPETPTELELKEQFAVDLPAYWRASNFTLEASQRTAADSFRGRFKATVELTSPTYVEERRLGDVVIVRNMGNPGDRRTVYGRVQARRQRGDWASELRLENDPMRSAGIPREFFQAGRVLVAGSVEEREFWGEQERIRDEARRAEEVGRLAQRQRFEGLLVGEWHGSMFNETDSRLIIGQEASGLIARLYHQGYLETLRIEVLAGDRILLTGYEVVKLDGGRVRYNLDTFELEMTPDGAMLLGAARDQGGASGSVRMRKVTG